MVQQTTGLVLAGLVLAACSAPPTTEVAAPSPTETEATATPRSLATEADEPSPTPPPTTEPARVYVAPDPASVRGFLRDLWSLYLDREPERDELDTWTAYYLALDREAWEAEADGQAWDVGARIVESFEEAYAAERDFIEDRQRTADAPDLYPDTSDGTHSGSGGTGDVASDCTYAGVPLHGRVVVVDSFADFDVKVVSSFPDLKVKEVDSFANSCGEWEFVDAFGDFSVRFVDSFGDFTIRFVDSFPGLP